jgi:hypothetical protein
VTAISWKSKIILFKIEETYGTDPTPTGAANAMLMTNVSYSPMVGNSVSRDLEFPYLAAQGKIPAGLRVQLKGRVELAPSGTAGTAPAWGPLVRACRWAETIVADTSVTYSPVSEDMESGTLWFWIGGTKQIVTGVRGDVDLKVDAQGIPYLEFTLTGLFGDPSEVSRATPTLTGFKQPKLATTANTPTFTVNSVALVMRSFQLSMNNQVTPRFLVGADEIVITDGAETASARVQAVPLTTFNPFSLAKAETEVAVSLVHGTAAGSIATLTLGHCQIDLIGDYQQQDNILEWTVPLIPLPSSGNDQWSLALT